MINSSISINSCKLIEFVERGNETGKLVAIENNKEVPFLIKRIFYIYGAKSDTIRGQHANKNSEFVLINVAGNCKVRLSDGQNEQIIVLDKPSVGLYIPKMIWKDMYDFSSDSVLLVLSNCFYDSNEYIRDVNVYKSIIENLKKMRGVVILFIDSRFNLLVLSSNICLRGKYGY